MSDAKPTTRSLFRVLDGSQDKSAGYPLPPQQDESDAESRTWRALPEPPPKKTRALHRWGLRILEARWSDVSSGNRAEGRPAGGPIRVLRLVSSLTQGGVGKVCLQTALALDPSKVKTTILVFGEKPRQVERRSWPPNLRVLAQPLSLAPAEGSFRFYRDLYRLSRMIEEMSPDIVHLHEPQFVLAVQAAVGRAARRGHTARLVVHLHNDYRQRNRSIPDVILPGVQRALRRSALIACSQTIESAARGWLSVDAEGIERIEDGADDRILEGHGTEAAETLAEAAGDKLVIASMANLAPHKRIEDFIDAGARLSGEGLPVFFLLMVYGKKEAAERVRRTFESKIDPAHGELLYRVGQPHTLLPRVDIGVSCSALEGLGLNILEYQIEGIPVVCTDLEPHLEMVEEGRSGLTYPVGDVERLTEILRTLISDPELRKTVGSAGKSSAQRRRWSDTAAATTRFYEKLLKGCP